MFIYLLMYYIRMLFIKKCIHIEFNFVILYNVRMQMLISTYRKNVNGRRKKRRKREKKHVPLKWPNSKNLKILRNEIS